MPGKKGVTIGGRKVGLRDERVNKRNEDFQREADLITGDGDAKKSEKKKGKK